MRPSFLRPSLVKRPLLPCVRQADECARRGRPVIDTHTRKEVSPPRELAPLGRGTVPIGGDNDNVDELSGPHRIMDKMSVWSDPQVNRRLAKFGTHVSGGGAGAASPP